MRSHIFSHLNTWQWQYDSWRKSLSTWQLFCYALCVAGLTGIMAQIKVYLPYTPVPITLQTFIVLLSPILIGRNWGALSQILYILIGCAGVPWFAGSQGGLSYLSGPTTGYLIGFVCASYTLGWIYDRVIVSHYWPSLLGTMIVCHIFCVYGFGLLYLKIWNQTVMHQNYSLTQLLWMGMLPFLFGDLLKIVLASVCGASLSNKEKSN